MIVLQLHFYILWSKKWGVEYKNDDVGKNKFRITDFFVDQCVYYTQADDHKKISHFPDGNLSRPVSDNAENGKQSQSEAQLQFDIG